MRTVYSQLYLHLVWATWQRRPLIARELREPLYACIAAQAAKLRCHVLAVGGMEDHVHLLVRMPTTTSIGEIAKYVKGGSSHLMTHVLAPGSFFKWQKHYGAFTLSKRSVPTTKRYVLNQELHHRGGRLHEELERTEDDGPPFPPIPG